MKDWKGFKVAAVSDNTNSFGLKQMILVAKDGEVYKTCASFLYLKNVGDILTMKDGMFKGCELTEKSNIAPKEIINEVWNLTVY